MANGKNNGVPNSPNNGMGSMPIVDLQISSEGAINLKSALPPVEVVKALQNVCTHLYFQHMEQLVSEKMKDGPLIVPAMFDPKKLA